MNRHYLDFEKPLAELHEQIEKLRSGSEEGGPGNQKELDRLAHKVRAFEEEVYDKLTPWQQTQLARHPERPSMLEYVEQFVEDFVQLHGDRAFRDDPAMVGGLGRIGNREVVLLGHQKGRNLKTRVIRNFGMAHPEGYRKALRLMQFAERFGKPLVCFIDTPGAYPGLGAEERGQSEAIARNLLVMSRLKVPVVVVVIGEGGSGGALAVGVGDRILILEHSIYSVISPEGCAAILWKDGSKAPMAAEALKITARDLLELGVVDEILPEPLGGSHRDMTRMSRTIRDALVRHLTELEKLDPLERVELRYKKFCKMGIFEE
ncbi:MAG: acetyl-CoA carboxylase carboxyltransferase subunit alpha [Nitrospirota bacterium]|nr:acetyl-CoA carboxylase carboxyltransferase subunit alpha [Nitrospirota bacterium]